MPKKKSVKKAPRKSKKDDDTKLFAFLATFLSILGFIIALVAKKDNKYVMFYAKQSLIIFIAYLIAAIATIVPVIGWIISPIIYLVTFVLWIISWIYALSGKQKVVPLIGKYHTEIKI